MQRLNTLSVTNRTRALCAFSLIEIMVGLFIIGVAASVMLPRLVRRSPAIEWPALQQELNNLLYFARQEAITTQKVHRLTFDKKKRSIEVEARDGEMENKPGVPRYASLSSIYFPTHYELPEKVSIEWVKLNKKDLFEEHKGMAWCYVVPNGLVQDVSVKLVREEDGVTSSMVFNAAPFLGSFADEIKEDTKP